MHATESEGEGEFVMGTAFPPWWVVVVSTPSPSVASPFSSGIEMVMLDFTDTEVPLRYSRRNTCDLALIPIAIEASILNPFHLHCVWFI